MVKDRPTRIPSTKSETEKPETSICTNRPMRIPIAIDIMPIANIVSALRPIKHHRSNQIYSNGLMVNLIKLRTHEVRSFSG